MLVCASKYALFTASALDAGAITLIILLPVILRDFLIVVVPLISSAVIGLIVCMPILPVLPPNNAPAVVPSAPEGGPANVHAARMLDQIIIKIIA